MLNTPILLIIFNRPDTTQRVFEAIRQAKPRQLFVAADGPREGREGEAEKCQQARAIIGKVDWDCKVLTSFSERNLGCGTRVFTGIDWAFSAVEEAIILEDDCVPTLSFFYFCQELLERYRHDQRVMYISGTNRHANRVYTDYSYYFSKYGSLWGWASWRRAWRYFDHEMKTWPEFKESGLMRMICGDPYEESYWSRRFDQMFTENPPDIWDYMWVYACWSQSGLSVIPNSNLISNIGVGPDATHTFHESPYFNMPTTDIWEISHPSFVVRHREADVDTFESVYRGGQGARKGARKVDTRPRIRRYLSAGRRKAKSMVKKLLNGSDRQLNLPPRLS